MPLGYWILIGCVCAAVAALLIRTKRSGQTVQKMMAGSDRVKNEFRGHAAELQKYKDMCAELLEENARLRAALEQHGNPAEENSASLLAGAEKRTHEAEHLRLARTGLAYREGLISGQEFSVDTLVHDMRLKAGQCDAEALLLCMDSGIRMAFSFEKEYEGEPVLRVILRVPEGGTCCIYEEGKSGPEADWMPVRACLDTMFAHGREVYLSYRFGDIRAA